MRLKIIFLVVAFSCLFAPLAHANSVWVDWSSGAAQPFTSCKRHTGTIGYTHTFASVAPEAHLSPDAGFPFTDPVHGLGIFTPASGSIEFTFSGVAPDQASLLTLGNVRVTNRYVITAFDSNNQPQSLNAWTDRGQYRIFSRDSAPNLWYPGTGELIGNGTDQVNSKNIFLGLTSNVARIHIDFDDVDQGFEYLFVGVAGGCAPAPARLPALSNTALAILALLAMMGGVVEIGRRRHASRASGSEPAV